MTEISSKGSQLEIQISPADTNASPEVRSQVSRLKFDEKKLVNSKLSFAE